MRVLLDHNIPAQLGRLLSDYEVRTARQMKWDHLENGDLLKAGENNGFDAMLTADQSIYYQQNNRLRKLALVIASTNHRPALVRHVGKLAEALARSTTGSFELVRIPLGSETLAAIE